jgi:hypothetical protein
MINYVRRVKELYTLPQQNGQANVVVQVLFSTTGTDTENPQATARTVNTLVFEYKGGSFTPFEQLTEDQVLSWIEDEMPPSLRNIIVRSIEAEIRRKLTPVVKPQPQQLPWG